MKRSVLANVIFFLIELGVIAALWFLDLFKDTNIWIKIGATALIVIDIVKDICTLIAASKLKPKENAAYVWKDRKRIVFLGLPFSFTRYRLTKEKLIVDEGFWNRKENEIRLYRVMDLSVNQTFWQRIFGLGTVTVTSSDKTDSKVLLRNIKRPKQVKEQISKLVEAERKAKMVTGREVMSTGGPGGHGGPDGPDGFGDSGEFGGMGDFDPATDVFH